MAFRQSQPSGGYGSRLVIAAGVLAIFGGAGGAAARAAVISVTADPAGGLIRSNGVTETGGVTRLIGSSSTLNQGLSNIYFFELPALGPLDVITDAVLEFNFASTDGSLFFNTDLYGLGFVNPASMSGSWFFEGPGIDARTRTSLGTGNSGTVSFIEDDILTPLTPTGTIVTDQTQAMIDFINSLYADGAVGGDFAVFHYAADQLVSGPTGAIGYRITHSGGAPDDIAVLQLTVAAVPEPASLLTCGGLGAALLLLRRRNVRRRSIRGADRRIVGSISPAVD